MLPIVDTHQHLWDLSRFDLPWLAGAAALAKDHLPSDYARATDGLGIAKTVYMEVDVAPHQRAAEADYVIDLCQRDDNPMAGAVLAGTPADPGLEAYLRPYKDQPYIKGIRQVLHVPEARRGHCLEAAFVNGIRLLGQWNLSFDLCLRPAELGDAVSLAEQCPETRFVLDHCGNADPSIVNGAAPTADDPFAHSADQWKRDIDALGQRPNVVCKISGIIARAPEGWNWQTLAPTVDHCFDAFGPDRVIFGGDWPVCNLGASYAEWAAALRQIIAARPEEHQRALLSENAERFYNL